MTRITKSMIAAMVFSLVSVAGVQVNANDYHYLDTLALDIQKKAQLLETEVRHYRHTPEYKHLRDDTRELRRLARHLHQVAHRDGSLAHIEADLQEIDTTFHHVESVFDRTEAIAAHGGGHVHGNTSHVKELLNGIENCIHRMQADVRRLRQPADCVLGYGNRINTGYRGYGQYDNRSARQYDNHAGRYNSPPVRQYGGYGGYGGHRRGTSIDRSGFSFGNENLRFRINF